MFGKYYGKSIDEIAGTDRGLLYLDWLRGREWLKPDMFRVVSEYLDDPETKRAVASALQSQRDDR